MSLPRAELINQIINQYNLVNPRYLEIGVWCGDTFKNVNTTVKDGIDPGQYCDCEYVNFKMTSDDFFAKHVTGHYDIIFIDGLHTAYQVSKDIYNSINHINPAGGWIILDDVYPHCEYEQERLNLRKCGAQTGDVWKAVYNVLDEIIDMSEFVYFTDITERGSLLFKLKPNNTKNITIDKSIPTCNVDGWYEGLDAEWDKYGYVRDFGNYISKLRKLNLERI